MQMLDGVREIVVMAAKYYLTIQGGILPAAYMSESFFSFVYDRLFKLRGDPPALTFMLGYDSAPIRAEQSLYDLAQWARQQQGLTDVLSNLSDKQFASAYRTGHLAGVDEAVWSEFCQRLAAHLARYGHTIYDLDFAKPLPADDPASLLETLKFFLSGQAPDPSVRQAASATAREQAVHALQARLRGPLLSLFRRLVRAAQGYAPLREDALADVGLGWPILRRMLHEIGNRLVAAKSIATPDDTFWLTEDELQSATRALDEQQPVQDYHAIITKRRMLWEGRRKLTPPAALPLKGGARFMGIDFSSMLPARTDQQAGDVIKGIGASPGRVTGPARVISGPSEFNQMRRADILVAKITTPAWTPLFALASGVVTDVGGPLSHSSIVAREYHIPAVLGTGVATERLHSDQQITVDGDAGTVTT
jgi:pyruvate,water dikinase